MARLAGLVVEALGGLFPGEPVYRADDLTAARVEGFEAERGSVGAPGAAAAEAPSEVIVAEGPCRFAVTLGAGHKTGLYLDQRDNHRLVAAHARGRRVLDAFAYTGAFACHALAAGAAAALLIESSAEAVEGARANLALNGLAERAAIRDANAFDELRALAAARERFGLVVLDPPPFTRRKDAVDAAARGYKEINLRGLRLLEPGGLLATFSCSHHVTPEMFESVCRAAAGDAGVPARVLATLTQARDHPVLLAVPETRYLTGLLLQAV
ncbi:MAG TPA: class I SAM-dependent methyltransferase [Methylomirabilota bacterium]|nr:class I SAM-dependent methyltransferase [Methylomirabilota bacterium]